jgi:4,5-DOPA dioxygenase extradiol
VSSPLPALFIGHGSPMNAIEDTPYGRAWAALGERIPRPKAILVVSAHWVTRGVAVTAQERPPTIHDFGRFPQALFDVQYPAPGAPDLVARVGRLVSPTAVRGADDWGLDHGAWSVLVHMFPKADIPVAQLSLDAELSGQGHYALAHALRPLRDEGVLILATGNIVHNLSACDFSGADTPPRPWAVQFEAAALTAIRGRDHAALMEPARLAGPENASLSIRGPEHYLPLLYTLAQQDEGESVEILDPGVIMGAISMASVVVGAV